MKEVRNAIRALQARAKMLEQAAKALTHLNAFANAQYRRQKPRSAKNKHHISRAGRLRISRAQKARWAKVHRNG